MLRPRARLAAVDVGGNPRRAALMPKRPPSATAPGRAEMQAAVVDGTRGDPISRCRQHAPHALRGVSSRRDPTRINAGTGTAAFPINAFLQCAVCKAELGTFAVASFVVVNRPPSESCRRAHASPRDSVQWWTRSSLWSDLTRGGIRRQAAASRRAPARTVLYLFHGQITSRVATPRSPSRPRRAARGCAARMPRCCPAAMRPMAAVLRRTRVPPARETGHARDALADVA